MQFSIVQKRNVQSAIFLAFLFTLTFLGGVFAEGVARDFEPSLYGAYHWSLWVVFNAAFLLSILAFIAAVWQKLRYWIYALSIVTILYSVFISLPHFRGWELYGRISDFQAHVGWTKAILQTGHISTATDFYPATHILMAVLNLLGVPFSMIAIPLTTGFFALFVYGIYRFARVFETECDARLYGIVAIVPWFGMFHASHHPAILSFFITPLIASIYLTYSESGSRTWLIVLFILGFVVVFMHPVSSVAMLIFLSFIELMPRWGINNGNHQSNKSNLHAIIAIGLPILPWYLSSTRFHGAVLTIFAVVEGGSAGSRGGGIIEVFLSYLTGSGLTAAQTVFEFIRYFGAVSLLATTCVILTPFIIYRSHRTNRDQGLLFVFIGILGSVLAAIFFFEGLVVSGPKRALRYALFGGILVIGYTLSRLNNSDWQPKISKSSAIATVLIVLMISTPLSVMTVFHPLNHLTETEKEGIKWNIETTENGEKIASLEAEIRQVQYIVGREKATNVFPFGYQMGFSSSSEYPKGLGYSNERYISKSVPSEYQLIVTKQFDREFKEVYYTSQYDTLTYYNDRDLVRLEQDPSANLVYSNGEYRTWRLI